MTAHRFGGACYLILRFAGWAGVTAALVAALWPTFFVLLGQGTFGGTMLQLDNFAARYLAASDAARAQFHTLFWAINAAAFAGIGLMRLGLLRQQAALSKPCPEETRNGQ